MVVIQEVMGNLPNGTQTSPKEITFLYSIHNGDIKAGRMTGSVYENEWKWLQLGNGRSSDDSSADSHMVTSYEEAVTHDKSAHPCCLHKGHLHCLSPALLISSPPPLPVTGPLIPGPARQLPRFSGDVSPSLAHPLGGAGATRSRNQDKEREGPLTEEG